MNARRWSLLWLPPLVALLLVGAVRVTSRAERTLVMDQTKAVRVVTYVVETGHPVRIPIEPNTDVLRIVAHAFGRKPLSPGLHGVNLDAMIHNTLGERTEKLAFDAPGTTARASAENDAVLVGDPVAVTLDVRDGGTGDVTLQLTSIQDADGLLIRAYRRETIGPLEAFRRRLNLGEGRREHLARRAGEPDWLDLDMSERNMLVAARWRKVAALADSEHPVDSIPLVLSPRVAAPRPEGAPIGTLALQPDERATGLLHGPVALIVRGEPAISLTASLRNGEGPPRALEGKGEVRVEASAGEVIDFEIATGSPQRVVLMASDPDRVSLGTLVTYFRTTPSRRVLVAAGTEPLVLRVSVRQPVPPSITDDVALSAVISVEAPSRAPLISTFAATVTRSRYDRYEPASAEFAPSDHAVFYVLVPAAGRATLGPVAGLLDVSLSELDPHATPRGGSTGLFAARWPTNADDFQFDGEALVQVARRSTPPLRSTSGLSIGHVVRPRGLALTHRSGRAFEPAGARLTVQVSAGQRLLLPARLYAKGPTDVLALVDGGHPRRKKAGIAERLTISRAIRVEGDVKTSLLLGDDLEPGPHVLTFVAGSAEALWVHLPWVRKGAIARESAWVSGDFVP